MKRLLILSALIFVVITMFSCEGDAVVASRNLSKDADMFRIYRRVVFYNGITDAYILQIEGYCSLDIEANGVLKVTVKADDGTFMKHYLGISDNVTYFVEQLHPAEVSDSRYKVIFKPSLIIPLVELTD